MTDEVLAHYGTPRHSGRYPWGSGGEDGDSRPRSMSLTDQNAKYKSEGMTEAQRATALGFETTTQLRAHLSIEKSEIKREKVSQAQKLRDEGWGASAIGKRMGLPESSVRSLLADGVKERADILETVSKSLEAQVAKKGYIDVGSGVEHHVGVSRDRLNTAIAILEAKGYVTTKVQVPTTGSNMTTVKVLGPPGKTQKEMYIDLKKNPGKIQLYNDFSDDGGRTMQSMREPLSFPSKKVAVRYAEEGGDKADGVIYVRPGVKDTDLGGARYAQVRIVIDGTHYLKGMAVYKDDLPDGVDLEFNTNKRREDLGPDKKAAMKKVDANDPDNPYGSLIKRQRGVMNIVNEEGDWDNWSRNLSSQTLSKQSPLLAKTQLNMTYEKRQAQLAEIMALSNPTVKRKLLESFADEADSAAVNLKAAALPKSSWHVILPFNSIKENEIYAPNFNNGDRVALIRYPHGGTFEIPELTVNNRSRIAKSVLGQAKDAVGIHHKVAERLSGADFDGDAVLVIPNEKGKIKTSPALAGLKGFDPQRLYKLPDDAPRMSPETKGLEMGRISNLITDMTLRHASHQDLALAVKHSMVVIDAEKHHLDYKKSSRDNLIPHLKEKYQGSSKSGASTLISRAGAKIRIPEEKLRRASEGEPGNRGPVDTKTGEKVYVPTGATYKNGDTKTIEVKRLAVTKNAHDLASGTPMEAIYADHSNRLKAMANQARLAAVNTSPIPYSPSAKLAYANEVRSLNAKLALAVQNRPLERQAQIIANTRVAVKRQANPQMDKDEVKKTKRIELREARLRTGAESNRIKFEPNEWAAIQAGAITNSKLKDMLDKADLEQVKKLATPKDALLMTSTKTARANQMLSAGYTQAEVAQALGVSLTTLKTSIGG